MTTTLVRVVLLVVAVWALSTPLWPSQSMKQRIVVAFAAMGFAILSGWVGALWARAARPSIPAPPGIEIARANFMKRGRIGFAVVFGVAAAVLAPFVPEWVTVPGWISVPLGAIIGALIGLVVGHSVAAENWISRMPRFTEESAPNKSLEQTRGR